MARSPEHQVVDEDPRLRIQIVNADSGRRAAQMDSAYQYIHDRTRGPLGSGIVGRARGFGRLWWLSNIGRDHTQHREFRRAGEAVRGAGGNYLSLHGASDDEYQQEMSGLVDRFATDIQDDLDPGETNADINNILLGKLKHAILQYAAIDSGDTDVGRQDLEREVRDFFREHMIDRGPRMMSYGHNILEVAKNARLARLHDESMARIEEAITGKYGVALAGVRTNHREIRDVTLDRRRRPFEFMNRNGFTYANETTASAAIIVGLTAGRVAVTSTVAAATRFAGWGFGASAIAFGRTYREGGRRRRLALRQWASGNKTPTNIEASVLERIERTRYDSVHAHKLYDQLGEVLTGIRDGVNGSDPETINHALDLIAEVKARRELSNQHHIDLIEYAQESQIEQERNLLYKRLREAIEAVAKTLPNIRDPALRNQDIDVLINQHLHSARPNAPLGIMQHLQNDIAHKDRLDRNRRFRQSALIGSVALVTGGLVGAAMQETIGRAITDAHGVLSDRAVGRHTFLAGLFRDTSIHTHEHAVHEHMMRAHPNSGVRVSRGLRFIPRAPFQSQIVDAHGNVLIDHIGYNRQGDLDTASMNRAQKLGILVTQGFRSYTDLKGNWHVGRHISELHAPRTVPTPVEVPWFFPVYWLRAHEKMNPGQKRENIPGTRLDTGGLAESHLRSLDASGGAIADRLAEKLALSKTNKNKKAEKPKAVIVIPADANQDGDSIFNTLFKYANQKGIDTAKDIEIVIFGARRKGDPRGNIAAEIERFRRGLRRSGQPISYGDSVRDRMKNLKIRYVEEEVPRSRSSARRVREVITDAVIKDLLDRDVDLDKTLLIYNGADNVRVDPRYVKTVIDKMARELSVDVLIGTSLRGVNPGIDPNLQHRRLRISRLVEKTIRRRPNYVGATGANETYMGSSGANVVVRPRAYVRANRHQVQPGYIMYDRNLGLMVRAA